MSQVITDHTQDLTGSEQYRLTQLYQPPGFVKQASHEQLCGGPEQIPQHLYADPRNRNFPCHTKAATWMSALFFGDVRKRLDPEVAETVATKLLKTAGYWKISPEVTELWEKMAQDEAQGQPRLADSDFAFVWQAGDQKERHYPLRNPTEVKMASHWFGEHHDQFNFADKHTVARKILVKASQMGAVVDNQELLDRCAGFGYCSSEDAAKAWDKRAHLLQSSHPDYSNEAVKVAASLRSATFEARDQGKRIKMAGLMGQFDQQTHLNRLYDDGLERPEDVLFQITEKVASEFLQNNVTTTTGAIYEKMALERLDIETVRSWLGDDLAEACGGISMDVEKLAEILPTLPRPDAEMFERMAQAAGISVHAREKAAATRGMSLDEMRAAAEQYKPTEQPTL